MKKNLHPICAEFSNFDLCRFLVGETLSYEENIAQEIAIPIVDANMLIMIICVILTRLKWIEIQLTLIKVHCR